MNENIFRTVILDKTSICLEGWWREWVEGWG